MYPEFEKTKIIDDMVYCNIGKAYQKSTFGFSYSNIYTVKISQQLSISVNGIHHPRVCSLVQDLNGHIYLRFRKITDDFHEDMLCQFYFKSKTNFSMNLFSNSSSHFSISKFSLLSLSIYKDVCVLIEFISFVLNSIFYHL